MKTLIRVIVVLLSAAIATGEIDKAALKEQVLEMFMHGYTSYMDHAWPADELMPLSCAGRVRGVTPSRGDVDDSLGNFSLTLIDTLDTLIVVGAYDEFEDAVQKVVDHVRFDSDLVVSVFETNIRVLGGLISGHLMAEMLRGQQPNRLKWYTDRQLLKMAIDLGDRLLPAFNTSSGLPYSRINLRHGMLASLKRQKDTCTACGGTMLLEMAALSRLTGNPVYEEKARKAMDFLWSQRHRSSDLMGTVLDVHDGNWVRRDSGIGAGIDSYYEYCLKAYILLGDSAYLERFNRHYDAVMRYVNKGPLFFDVQMHRPTIATRSFMDSLLAFWPGLQVLKGDISEAVQMHEMLFQVVQKHKFLPEAFTHDLQVHWAEHPLRPEFIESTYFLYRATKDPHYLEVAKTVMDSLNAHVRVRCGWAGVKDIRVMTHEDRMDSFVLSETFKYLFMIFAEPADLPFDPDNYVLTTEAHFLPLNLGDSKDNALPRRLILDPDERLSDAAMLQVRPVLPLSASPKSKERLGEEARAVRERTQNVLEELHTLQRQSAAGQRSPQQVCAQNAERLRAIDFNPSNPAQLRQLEEMGITLSYGEDSRLLLTHQGTAAKSPEHAQWGMDFMTEIAEAARAATADLAPATPAEPVYLQILGPPHLGFPVLTGSLALYGSRLMKQLQGPLALAYPFRACDKLDNAHELAGKVVIVERSDCMFVDKTKLAQSAGAVGVIVVDHNKGSSWAGSQSFSMSGDAKNDDDIHIPTVFLFRKEGEYLIQEWSKMQRWHGKRTDPIVAMGRHAVDAEHWFAAWLRHFGEKSAVGEIQQCAFVDGLVARVVQEESDGAPLYVQFAFRFGPVTMDSEPIEHQGIVERHVNHIGSIAEFASNEERHAFMNLVRAAGYLSIGLSVKDEESSPRLMNALRTVQLEETMPDSNSGLTGRLTRVRCFITGDKIPCELVPGG
ncbi:hypothetical protein PFISCL1PPCAC_22499 [Pristionchus fissidentatus]|uniref:alpha-1,2-Mannosidase n=1 Tax=Pristionchus fissidentatus TaxID=1538716 RepID=A0AAV5WJN4_9BILA|nr:hypothetical protein PFISCL1PPCAC_22499 [Pristionchus fissidentatus]